tara:strand:- start:193 stop:486 length:294 start_codon:yes stop_codon:yes gene_type:complete
MANYKKMVNGVEVELSDEEQALRESEEKTWADGAASRAFAALRAERDRKIAKTDWRAMPDLTLSDAWKTYRQELRDLPGTLNDTTVQETITWPTEPS